MLDRGLQGQRFRPIYVNELVSTPLRLPEAGADVDAALQAAGADPDWVEIARQLSQLRTRAFMGLYLRRDQYDIECVPIYAWSSTVSQQTVDQTLEWVWTITQGLAGRLGKFHLSDSFLGELTKLAEAAIGSDASAADGGEAGSDASPDESAIQPGEDAGPIGANGAAQGHAAVVRVARAIVDMAHARLPKNTVLVVGSDHVPADVSARADQGLWYKQDINPFHVHKAMASVVVVDGSDLSVHGSDDWWSLDLAALRRDLPFLEANG